MSEFRFRSISWEWIDGIWPRFSCALILTTPRLGLLHINFHKLTTELWPLMSGFCFRSISWEQIDGIWPNSAYAFILTTSRLGLLRANFCEFITELWRLIDVVISFPLNILRTNQQNLTKCCICIYIGKMLDGIDTCLFLQIYNSFISGDEIDGIWPNFAYALILTRSRLGLLHISFFANL